MTARRCSLVTGGAGFIGSHLVDRLLRDGDRVLVLDNFSTGRRDNLAEHKGNPRLLICDVDIADFDVIRPLFCGVDRVFHLAALADIVPSIERPIAYMRANVTGTQNVVEAARLAQVRRFIYTASSSCYGIPDRVPTPETAAMRPQYPYAASKRLGEDIVMHWVQVYGLPAVSLRLFNVYGPRSRTSGTYGAVFGVFLAQKLAGQPFTVVGDGTQTRDFTYVTDVVDAFVRAAESNLVGEILNIGSGAPQSVNRLVELLSPDGGRVAYVPKRPGEPDVTCADAGKARQLLGWAPQVSLTDGVATLLANIDYWRSAPVWTPASIAEATRSWFQHLRAEEREEGESGEKELLAS
jgi:UDP-glucose 4-epimerase